MSVIPITVFFSLLLAGSFAVLFAREQRRRRFASLERDSLLPLADETPRLAAKAHESDHDHAPHHAHDHDHSVESDHAHEHPHGKGRCGCLDGTRPPCAGCQRRSGATPLTVPAPLS